jgi:2-dehydro-3-deoxygalactonokinase
MKTPLIAIDWGSTNFRAKLVLDGLVIASVETPDGIRNRSGRDFDDILTEHCALWKEEHPGAYIVMSGMIGSREGWVEAPYVPAPARIADLSEGLVSISSRTLGEIAIVPGVRYDAPESGTTDVMRGEETQIAGLLAEYGDEDITLCLPGTHSKWIKCRDGAILSFRTWLTGEAFDLLTRQSLIAGSEHPADAQSDAFHRGLALSGGDGGLLHHLFLGRTEMLSGRITAAEMRSILSGILLGHEIREALDFAEPDARLLLVGESPAAQATASALTWWKTPFQHQTNDTHLPGILAILRASL